MKKLIEKISAATLLNLSLAGTALAAQTFTPEGGGLDPRVVSFTTVENIVRNLTATAGVVFFSLAVVFMLYAGYLYLTAGGESEQVGKAKNQLIYSIIAIIIGLGAYSATAIIRNFLQSGGQ